VDDAIPPDCPNPGFSRIPVEGGSHHSCNGSLVDTDVAPAGGGERFTVPTSPSLAQSKASDASHEIELRWVSQAQSDRAEDGAVGSDADVVHVEDLRDGLVLADVQHDMVEPPTSASVCRHLQQSATTQIAQ
jgi:hypothetical protein